MEAQPETEDWGMSLVERMRRHAVRSPDRVAMRFPRGRRGQGWDELTYGALGEQILRASQGFQRLGIRRGDRVLLAFKPSIRFFGIAFGLLDAGAAPLFIDPAMGRRTALDCLKAAAPRGMVAPHILHLYRWVDSGPFRSVELPMIPGRSYFWGIPSVYRFLETPVTDPPLALPTGDDEAVVVFTSGSTGPPKAVSLSHGCMAARVDRVGQLLGWSAGESIVETLLVYTIMQLALGMTTTVPQMDVTRPKRAEPAAILEAIAHAKPRTFSASPVVWHSLVPHCEAVGATLETLDIAVTSGAPIPVWLHRRARPLLREGVDLLTPYGSTEALPLSCMGSREILDETAAKTDAGAGTCVGRVAEGIALRIIEVTDDPLPTWADVREVEPGAIGEIVVSGPGVSPTYFKPAGADAFAKIDDTDGVRWHRMGDLGYFDAQGRLWFCGRMSHRVRTPDGMIPCIPVEGIYNDVPGVFRTALVGCGEPGDHVPVLCVELEPDATWSDALQETLAARAEGTRWAGVVQRFLVHPDFPTDVRHNSKIRRELLRTWAADQLQTRLLTS